ncbi:glyoxylase-like metal-dependent hydrolase (beta-lactamase superfamily II) [Paenibacillus rhizosphaerae]|uniref:Glyoxylase-like metal-dependent hydrolase (Beta-lactamase superfamily II) n=1 Tax=Paenibacillus rhizosphaerae TaxID=297318 RepID=A0A839TTT2_9BACL|nr:MBL fold metallo-hydrolase [Paenibacillus rhizosphaerae]MBB3129923.1 glyoxylase-like metal-dependent hydrolase (beta-lactamase superfamily II) [Paenibacillus rhizosphaerae]
MIIENGVSMLELQIDGFGGPQTLHPTLVWDGQDAVLMDTGTPGQWGRIRTEMERLGVPAERLRAIVLTHQDIDHIGSLPEILREAGASINVYAHPLEKPYIEGERPLMKATMEHMAWQLEGLPEGERRRIVSFLIANLPKGRVDHTLEDGQVLPYCGGIEVIYTPGHTPGHLSLYLQRSQTLVAGDSMFSVNGKLMGAHRPSTPDMDTAVRSLQRYLDYGIESVICYHGGLVRGPIRAQLEALAGMD